MFSRISKRAKLRLISFLRTICLPISTTINKLFFALTQQQPEILINTKISGKFNIKYVVNSPRSNTRARHEHTWEPELLDLIYSLAPESNVSSGLFIDVGANVGTYSLIAGKIGWSVIAIEPNYANSYLLSRNIEANELGGKVIQIKVALSDKTRITQLIHHKKTLGGNSGATIDAFYGGQNEGTMYSEKILSFTLDDLLVYAESEPKLLKVDTDGNELYVLKGASRLLGTKSLSTVLVEVSSIIEKKEVIDLLNNFGFVLSTLKNQSNSIFMQNLIFTRSSSK